MKCVIVVFALLCSAQALKMDRPYKMTMKERMDRTDKQLGRPLRSLSPKKAATEADAAHEVGNAVASFGDDNGLGMSLSMCHTYHSNAEDIVQCAGEFLAEDAGLNSQWCGYINQYISDADYMMDGVAQTCVDESDMGDKLVDKMEESKKVDSDKRVYSAEVSILNGAAEYWNGIGADTDAQNSVDNGDYCDSTVGIVMAASLSSGKLHKRYSTSGDHMDAAYDAAKDIADLDFGGRNVGSMGTGLLADYQNAKNEVGPHMKMNIKHYKAYKQARKNWRSFKAGKFHVAGRAPQ